MKGEVKVAVAKRLPRNKNFLFLVNGDDVWIVLDEYQEV